VSFMADAIAHDLVAKLEMVPGHRYVLVLKRGTVGQDVLQRAQASIHQRWGIETLALVVSDTPAEAIQGIEIIPQESQGEA
jgi:hypothetical protein